MYQLLTEVLGTVQDYGVELLVISLLFTAVMQRRAHFGWRVLLGSVLFIGVTNHRHSIFTLFGLEIFGHWPIWSIGHVSFAYIAIFLLAALVVWCCVQEKFSLVLYFCSTAYVLQHFLSQLAAIIGLYLPSTIAEWQDNLIDLAMMAVLLAFFFLWFFRKNQHQEVFPHSQARILFMLVTVVIVSLLSILFYQLNLRNQASMVYDMICCLLLLYAQLAINRRAEDEIQKETMERMIAEKTHQMAAYRESIDLINMKCHDLRKQISTLRKLGTQTERDQAYQEIKASIDIYDTSWDTGCDALDIALTEKSLLCRSHQIQLNCIADGTLLDFIPSTDCYSLFDNLLDNAIEAVLREPEGSRDIRLQVVGRGSFVSILAENTCTRDVQFDGELPAATSKEDKDNHGFGTRSIRYIVEKYKGHVVMKQEQGRFQVCTLLPRPA